MMFTQKIIVGRDQRFVSKRDAVKRGCVLLTATITVPPGAVARSDSSLRLNDYLESLRYYLSLPSDVVDRILFVENSGNDLIEIEKFIGAESRDKTVEIISFHGNDHPVWYGKAYGEFRLMDFGLEHASILSENDIFWKVTGRLKVLNLADMIARAPRHYSILCDLHYVPIVGTRKLFNNKWMDLRVFSCSVKAYRDLFAGQYATLGPHCNQEHFYRLVMSARQQMKVYPRFPEQPVVFGVSGRHNRQYHGGFQRTKTEIRTLARKVLPFIWL